MLHTLGLITVVTPGVPINAVTLANTNGTNSGEDPNIPAGNVVQVYSVTIQNWHASIGARIWLGRSANMNVSTGLDVLAFIPLGQSVTIAIDRGPVGGRGLTDLRLLWLDVESAGDAALIQYVQILN